MTTISSAGKAKLQATLDKLAEQLPCVHVAVATPSEIIYEGRAGVFDALEKGKPEAKKADQDDILWFASSTKLLTALCYLRLVDQGKLALDTDLRPLYEPFKQATSKIIKGFESDGKAVSLDNANPIPIGDTVDVVKQFNEDGKGKAILVDSDEPVTLGQMLNQTSGFGMEFGTKVQLWKKVTEKGKGFVNSCKAENLVNTPLCHKPGTKYEYGNSAEWLALMLPEIVGKSTEDFLQDEILKPLGTSKTTYYPFASEDKAKHLMPLRYGKDAEKGGDIQWEVLDQQLPLLTLPRDKANMDYPAGGGGIYSRVADWILVLQHILAHYLSLSGDKAKRPSQPLLKDETVKSLFQSTLPESAVASFCEFYSMYLGLPDSDEQKRKLESGDAGWTTAQGLYAPKDGRRRSGWGRRAGSIGWGGAAGTEYWIDPASGIAAVFTTQILPGRCPAVANAKLTIERAIYEALEA